MNFLLSLLSLDVKYRGSLKKNHTKELKFTCYKIQMQLLNYSVAFFHHVSVTNAFLFRIEKSIMHKQLKLRIVSPLN